MRIVLKRSLVFWGRMGLIVCLGLMSGIIVLITVPECSQWLIYRITDRTPGLTVERVSGVLNRRLSVQGIHYQSETLSADVQEVSVQMRWLDLLAGQLQLASLTSRGIHLVQKPGNAPENRSIQIGIWIPLPWRIERISLDDIRYQTGGQSYHLQSLQGRLSGFARHVQLSGLQVQYQTLKLQAEGWFSLSPSWPFSLKARIQGRFEAVGLVDSHWQLQGNKDGMEFNTRIASPGNIQITGELAFKEKPELDLHARWTRLLWPLNGNPLYISRQGSLTLQGHIGQYQINLQSLVRGRGLPESRLLVAAKGTGKRLQFKQLQLDNGQGQLSVSGSVDGWDNPQALFDVHAANWPLPDDLIAYPGQLSLQARVSVSGASAQLQLQHLHGKLANYPLKASGRVRYQDRVLRITELQLAAGNNRLWIDGTLGTDNTLQFRLQADDLSVFDDGLQGHVQAQGKLIGLWRKPLLQIQLQGQQIAYDMLRLGQFTARGEMDTGLDKRWTVSVLGQGLQLDGNAAQRLSIHSAGQLLSHKLHIGIQSQQAGLEMELAGGYRESHWRGDIHALRVSGKALGHWLMRQDTALDVTYLDGGLQIDSSRLCLDARQTASELCLRAQWQARIGQFWQARIKALPLDRMVNVVPQMPALQGTLSADLDLRQDTTQPHDAQWQGVLHLQSDGRLLMDSDGHKTELPFRFVVQSDLEGPRLNTRFSLDAIQQTLVQARVALANWRDGKQSRLDGQVKINIADLSFFNALDLPVHDLNGAIKSEFAVQGRLAQPYLTGWNGHVHNVHFSIPALGSEVDNLSINARQTAARVAQLSGEASIGKRQLHLQGRIQSETGPGLQLYVQGEGLKIVQLPEAEVYLSPRLQLTLNQQGLKLAGSLAVPQANIVLTSLPAEAVAVSDDEVIVPVTAKQRQNQVWPVNMDIRVSLGKQVHVQGYGLKTRLQGDLQAVYRRGRIQLFNELNLREGVYQSYGQDLKLEKGQLLFTGDIKNPAIHLLAFRKAIAKDDPVTAYLKVTGTLEQPKSSIYTVPALPETEALAYLLTGGPLNKGGGSNAALLAKVAMYYGKEPINKVVSGLGIEEFDFKSTDVGEASLILGKRITPKLYVRYIMDVLSSHRVLAVEYRLTKHIRIEARSGETHSSDIKYHLEFD